MSRGEVLAFAGAAGGALAGWGAGGLLNPTAAGLGAAAGLVGGIFAAHWVNTKLLSPEAAVAGLGDVPPGFYELPGPSKFTTDPIFTRGVLVRVQDYVNQQRANILGGGMPADAFFRKYPRFTLYGGPTSAQYVNYVESFLKKWADQNDLIYLAEEPALLVTPDAIKPTWPYNEFRFSQYQESVPPHVVYLGYDKNKQWGWHYA